MRILTKSMHVTLVRHLGVRRDKKRKVVSEALAFFFFFFWSADELAPSMLAHDINGSHFLTPMLMRLT
jgi:hypothetical protein